MKGTGVRGKVENSRRQRSVHSKRWRVRAPASCLPVYSRDLGLHSLPWMKQTLQYNFVQNLSL